MRLARTFIVVLATLSYSSLNIYIEVVICDMLHWPTLIGKTVGNITIVAKSSLNKYNIDYVFFLVGFTC